MSELKEFCCICIKKEPRLQSIQGNDESNIKYKDKLSVCVSDQNWKEEYNICIACVRSLDLAFSFIQICLKSEELRTQQLKILQEQNLAKNILICDICKRKFTQKRLLAVHIRSIHEALYQSPVLKSEELDIKDIKSEEPASFTSNANDCNYSSEEEKIPISKKKYNKRKIPLTCEYCGKAFNRRQHYSAHIRAKHTFEKPYKCDICDAKYSNSHSLLVHKRNHNNEKPFVCSYCGKRFVCSGDLYHHSKIHLNKREYKCNVCDKCFNTASILRTHKICMHLEPKDWKYVCKYCDKRFPINSSLVTHMKRHIGIREFTCHICNKKFFDKPELSKHLKSHTNERFFKCNICENKEYKNSYGLKKHMKIIHDIGTLNIVKPEKKFACSSCPKTFAFNNKLQKHLYTHTGVKPFKCECCDKRFIENYYRKLHLKKKHNIDDIS